MTDLHIALLTLVSMMVVALFTVWWVWAESGDVLDEVDDEWEPIEALRKLS